MRLIRIASTRLRPVTISAAQAELDAAAKRSPTDLVGEQLDAHYERRR
jgi:hypothetical protein